MYWALFFLIIGIRDVIDAKPLLKNKDIYSLNEQVRKKYRRRRGISYLLCSAIAGCIFAYERMNGTGIDIKTAFLYYGIPYAVPITYIIYLKIKYHVPWFWSAEKIEDAGEKGDREFADGKEWHEK